jgi:PKD repeat protein
MKKIFFLVLLLAVSHIVFSQENKIKLKSGEIVYYVNNQLYRDSNINYYFMSFLTIPTLEVKAQISDLGVSFLEYIPNKTFVVNLHDEFDVASLSKYEITSLIPIEADHKLHPKLKDNIFPSWAIKDNQLSIKVLLYKDINLLLTKDIFEKSGFKINNTNLSSNSITITINFLDLVNIAKINSVWFIEPIDPPSFSENKSGRTLHRSNTINTNYASGRHYNGEGINIMMQDDGIIGPHIDYQGRIDQSNCGGCSTNSSNDHGDHVAGTIMGSGNLDPVAAGMSDAAFLYVFSSSNNNYYDVPAIYQNNDVIITSKSYSNGCNAGYTSLSRDLDEQINLYPSLLHVFSAGNDGNSDCLYGAGSGWGNVTGGHKQGKNVIAVANLSSSGSLASSSSRGPAADGRIKPDIGAKGSSVNSTITENDYGLKTGTSMSCPGIAGVLGQLYQAYKELNGGQNPNSSIIKNILLNAADDIGNPGPDFKHGWGEVNVLRSTTIIEDNQYFIDNISQGANNSHSIAIPSGTKQLKLMVYWHDKEASANAIPALVNDLDIELFDASGNSVELPWVLDHTANSVALNSNAVKGIDDINNMEQITMDNPITGNYSLVIGGNSIPFGPQEYSVSYVFIKDEITLTYPVGGEGWVPNESEIIRWDAYGNSGNFTLEYSLDGGANWIVLSSNINGSDRQYTFSSVPNVVSDVAKVRISRNGIIDESDENFTIISVPQNIVVEWLCPDSIYVSWDVVSGATSYEVSMLGNIYMDSMITTTNVNAFFLNPNPSVIDSWFSVTAYVNGKMGRRAVAINSQPININCVAPPVANFSVIGGSSCSGTVSFTDISLNQPSNWLWDFGDGNTSNLQNPIHTYLQQGSYDVNLFVSNALGQDSILISSVATINFLPAPIAYNDTSYVNPSVFSLISTANDVEWYSDTLGSLPIYLGTPFITPLLTSNTTYYVRENIDNSFFGGALDTNIGNGDYYNGSNYLIFDSYFECKLVSADIYAQQVNTITFELRDNNGLVLEDTIVTVAIGKQTLYFDFDIPISTGLQLGLNASNAGLYRNNSGAVYPYNISNLVSFVGASNSSTQDNWYNYYNIKFSEKCISEFTDATAVFITPQSITENQNFISIFPNPVESKCTIISSNSIKQIRVIDISARLCLYQYPNSNICVLDVSTLSRGVYTIELITEKENLKRQLIVK